MFLILYCISADGEHRKIDLKYKEGIWKNEKKMAVEERM
jgi:hypothetical protein